MYGQLTLAVLPTGEEAVAGGAEALVAALGVLAGMLAQAPHAAFVQVWSRAFVGEGVMETEIHAESQMPRWPDACPWGSGQAQEVPALREPPLLPALPHSTLDLGVRRVLGLGESRELRSAHFTFTKALGESLLPAQSAPSRREC